MEIGIDFADTDHGFLISLEQATFLIRQQRKNTYFFRDDPFSRPATGIPKRVLDKCQDVVFNAILDAAEAVGLEYISILTHELNRRGQEKPHVQLFGDNSNYNDWPAIWEVAKRVGINLCGSSNQSQVEFGCLGKLHVGLWDVKTRIRLGEPRSKEHNYVYYV